MGKLTEGLEQEIREKLAEFERRHAAFLEDLRKNIPPIEKVKWGLTESGYGMAAPAGLLGDIRHARGLTVDAADRIAADLAALPEPREPVPTPELKLNLDAEDADAVARIKTMLSLGKQHPKAPGFYREAGLALTALRQDKTEDYFERILRETCELGLSRAYELMEFAAGGKTLHEFRAGPAERMRKMRARRKARRHK